MRRRGCGVATYCGTARDTWDSEPGPAGPVRGRQVTRRAGTGRLRAGGRAAACVTVTVGGRTWASLASPAAGGRDSGRAAGGPGGAAGGFVAACGPAEPRTDGA